jgi:outer membrane lipoprotein-sorting protein
MNIMKKSITILLLATLFISGTNTPDPKEISEKAAGAIHFDAMEMTSTLTITDKNGATRIRKVSNITKKFGTTTKSKIRFLSPAEVAGTTILIYDHDSKDDDMWIYMPSLRNTRRIISSEKGKSFMGSEFSNADMSKPNPDDYNYKLLGTETIKGKAYWKIESSFISKTNEKNNGFSKKVSIIDKENFLNYKTEYYGSDGKHFKTMVMEDFRKQPNGKHFAWSMKVENIKNGRKSDIKVEQFKPATTASEKQFDVNNIEAE